MVATGRGTAVWLSPMVVLIAVRCDFERNYWLHPHLVQCLLSITVRQQVPKGIEPFVTLIFGKGGAAPAANAAADEFLEHKQAEWLGIWDADATPPVDIVQILSDIPDDVSIITPVTFMQLPEGVLPQQGNWEGEGANRRFRPINPEVQPSGRYLVDRAGGCCWFIRRRVFEVMERPFFANEYDPNGKVSTSDDIYFQQRALALGFKTVVDTRFRVSHLHTLDMAFVWSRLRRALARAS